MKTLPEIGARVRYQSERSPERVCFGTVRRIYPGDRWIGDNEEEDDEEGRIVAVRVGEDGWAEYWSAAVEVDEPLPEWWQYSGTNRFAPAISELQPEQSA
jgi:hypothetical protein